MKKKICIHTVTRILIIIFMICFVIDLQLQRTHSLCLLNCVSLKLCCLVLTAGKELKSKNTRKGLQIINQNFLQFTRVPVVAL